jgi:hypothetical protein
MLGGRCLPVATDVPWEADVCYIGRLKEISEVNNKPQAEAGELNDGNN